MNQAMLLFVGFSVVILMTGGAAAMFWSAYFEESELFDPGFTKFTGYVFLLFAVFSITVLPIWIEYEVVPPSEYTVEYTETETIWRYDDMEISSDSKYWSDIAEKHSQYCVYVSRGYNLFGMWPGDGMLTLRNDSSCEDVGKFEFGP